MNKQQFLDILRKELEVLSEEDKNDILYDYEEHFTAGIETGKTEEEIAANLGDPRDIAKQFKAEHYFKKAEDNSSVNNIFRALFASLSLGFVNLVFVLGPFIGILGMLFGLFAAAGTATVVGMTMFIGSIFPNAFSSIINIPVNIVVNPIVTIFTSIGVTAFGLLFLIADVYLAKFLYVVTIKYLKFNLRVITGK